MTKNFTNLRRLLCLATFCLGTPAILSAQTVVSAFVANPTDDQEETIETGDLDIASSDLELTDEGGSTPQIIGLRFTNVNIPKGALIKSAYVQFTADNTNDDVTKIYFQGEATDNAETFAQTPFAVSSRKVGDQMASWSPEPWDTELERGDKQKSSDIRLVIQEIIDRPGWQANNALALILTGYGEREAESYEGATEDHADAGLAAELIVEYDMPTVVTSQIDTDTDDQEENLLTGELDIASSDLELANENGVSPQIIGLRFNNIDIPQGAVITSATIQFAVDETNAEPVTVIFQGEATDNAVTFEQVNGSVSSRAKGKTKVEWTIDPWTSNGDKGVAQLSTDIRDVIQEIINRPGWTAMNSLAVFITGEGTTKRVAESFEGDAANAATISISYTLPAEVSSQVAMDTDDQEESIDSGALDFGSSDLELGNEGGFDAGASPQVIGIRFQNIDIPQGAFISNAKIQFQVDELDDEETIVTIKGEATDSSYTYAQEAFSVSSRPTGVESAMWEIEQWDVVGEKHFSVDISNVIQEIISRPGWKANNALSVIITGSGERTVESFEGDASGAAKLFISYAIGVLPKSSTAPIGTFPVPFDAVWRYLDNGTDNGTAFAATDLDDASWSFGPAELGYGDNDEATTVGFGADANNKYPTTYFRHPFEVTAEDIENMDSLVINLVRDDGAILYLNGTEIVRSNMPEGAITNTTFASSNVAGGAESQAYTYTISKELLVEGVNYLAAEVHQDRAESSDLSFKMSMEGRRYDRVLVPAMADWKYNDQGLDLSTSWKETGFVDTDWPTGTAVFGYGSGDEATELSYGDDITDKIITYYFRKTFEVTDTVGRTSLMLNLKRDDGAVVYINGTEVYRNNMASGEITFTSKATTFIEGGLEDEFVTAYLDKSVLTYGTNLVAVEIHQDAPTSSDMRFDLTLALPSEEIPVSYTGLNVTCDPTTSDLIGCFTSVLPQPQLEEITYPNATHTFQTLLQSLDAQYAHGKGAVPNGNDFTGYIPKNGSSTEGWLSINHENSPGGVSILDIHYDEKTGLWVVDSINKVDFSPLVQTVRNCSGGVTPWGTVITSEETYNNGDANGDGYTDVGWQVEIDPATRKIVDYDGDGNPDKLWAMGRMSHENIVLANDSLTAYEAEDGGTGCVYKFVANEKMNLSEGNLYVLKRDATDPTIGTWIQVPNTTQTERNTARDIAGGLGGTNWGGPEDVEIDPLDPSMVYFAAKGPGIVYRFKDEGMTVSGIEAFLSPQNYPITYTGGSTEEGWGTGNDNLAFDGEGNLWIMQDGGRNHMWVAKRGHSPSTPNVELFGTTPRGSEPTGITFTPDYKFAFISFQNPSGGNVGSNIDAAGNEITFNKSTTVVYSRNKLLGVGAAKPIIELGPDTVFCGETAPFIIDPLEISEGLKTWKDGSHEDVLEVNTTGKYYVSIIGNNGQQSSDTIYVTYAPLPELDLGVDTAVCVTCSFELDAGEQAEYLWSTEETTQKIMISSSDKYSVWVKDENGCEAEDDIIVLFSSSINGVGDELDGFSVAAYPNPFNGNTKIKFTLDIAADVEIEVFNTQGTQVATLANGSAAPGEYVYDFNTTDTGVYILKVRVNDQVYDIKLVNY